MSSIAAADDNAQGTPKITLYLLQHSQAIRILWLLKVLNLQYSLISISRSKDRAYPELRRFNPLGKSPVLVVDDKVISESRLCANALVSIRPIGPGREDEEVDLYFQEVAGASFTPAVHMCLLFDIMRRAAPWPIRPLIGLVTGAILSLLKKELDPYMDLLNARLIKYKYLAGEDLGVSDILMSWPIDLSVAKSFVSLDRWPGVAAWHERITGMKTYKSAVQESGGYDLVNLGT